MSGNICFNIRNLKKEFVDFTLELKNVSFEYGSITTICGESGSGKSTLLNILSLLDKCQLRNIDCMEYFPPQGDGNGAESISYKKAFRTSSLRDKLKLLHFGTVFQRGYLIDYFNVYENIIMPIKITGRKIDNEIDRLIDDLLGYFNLSDKKWEFPMNLSVGQYQRISIIRTLVKNPTVIFADEPTSNLDSVTSMQVMNLFIRWIDPHGNKYKELWGGEEYNSEHLVSLTNYFKTLHEKSGRKAILLVSHEKRYQSDEYTPLVLSNGIVDRDVVFNRRSTDRRRL